LSRAIRLRRSRRGMLIFGSNVTGPASTRCPHRHSIYRVETLLIGPAIIIYLRLSEVVAVGKWLTGDVHHAAVDGFNLGLPATTVSNSFRVAADLPFQRPVNSLCFVTANSCCFDRIRRSL